MVDDLDEADEQYYKEQQAKVEVLARAWRKKWPLACKICRGEGVHTTYGGYWTPPEAEYCTRLENDETLTCCRCGQPNALTEDLEGPCKHCGWDFDDMEPFFIL